MLIINVNNGIIRNLLTQRVIMDLYTSNSVSIATLVFKMLEDNEFKNGKRFLGFIGAKTAGLDENAKIIFSNEGQI